MLFPVAGTHQNDGCVPKKLSFAFVYVFLSCNSYFKDTFLFTFHKAAINTTIFALNT